MTHKLENRSDPSIDAASVYSIGTEIAFILGASVAVAAPRGAEQLEQQRDAATSWRSGHSTRVV